MHADSLHLCKSIDKNALAMLKSLAKQSTLNVNFDFYISSTCFLNDIILSCSPLYITTGQLLFMGVLV
jgi:hypothetical protein